MEIIRALNITSLFDPEGIILLGESKNPPSLPELEVAMVEKGEIEEGSFGFFKVVYADGIEQIYFDYPTDMNEDDAYHLAEEVAKVFYP